MKPMADPHEARGWRSIFHRALDLVYPPSCAVCDVGLTGGRSLCAPCGNDLPRLIAPFCGKCGEMFDGKIEGEFTCPNCSDLKLSFEFARPSLVRDDRTLDMIHRLKYKRELHLATELGKLGSEAFSDERFATALREGWPLIPVPLHRWRYQQRHFNQSEEIAREMSRRTGLPLVHALRRVRSTGHQTSLTRAQRLENLRGAFEITRKGKQQVTSLPAGAILVDDVLTTGSTVNECAKTLKKAGFKNVAVVTVMRG